MEVNHFLTQLVLYPRNLPVVLKDMNSTKSKLVNQISFEDRHCCLIADSFVPPIEGNVLTCEELLRIFVRSASLLRQHSIIRGFVVSSYISQSFPMGFERASFLFENPDKPHLNILKTVLAVTCY